MQEVTLEFLKSFIKFNNPRFVASQTKLCIPIIYRLCQKMSHGIKFDEIKVCGDIIIDGHHRYLSALIMNFDLGKVDSNVTSATKAIAWSKVEFDEHDWDTLAKIEHLNELDAKYNGLELEYVRQMVSG